MLEFQTPKETQTVVEVMSTRNDGELCQILRQRILTYKKAHPRLSSQQIAKRFNIASSTLSRIENMDIKTPSFDQVVKVLRGTGNTDELLEFVEKFYPELSRAYVEYFKSKATPESTEIIQSYISNPKYFKILMMITSVGMNEKEVSRLYGNLGLSILEDLIAKKIVTYSSSCDGYIVSDQMVVFDELTSVNIFKNFLAEFAEDYEYNDLSRMYSVDFVGINKEKVLPEIMSILRTARLNIKKLTDKPENQGDDALFVGIAGDIFFKRNNYEN
jgi:transcriptional regulator with XRE-family HTH domain